jgi:hypothetical protein
VFLRAEEWSYKGLRANLAQQASHPALKQDLKDLSGVGDAAFVLTSTVTRGPV